MAATLTKLDVNKFSVHRRLAQLESLVGELQREIKTIELKEGKPGRDAVSITGPAGPRGNDGKDGAPSTVPGPPGPQGPAGQSIRGDRGPAGPDTISALEEFRTELDRLRALLQPLNAEFCAYLEQKKRTEAAVFAAIS